MIETQATTNTDDLIADLADLNERLVDLYSRGMCTEDKELRMTYKRSFERLDKKRIGMLVQLRDAINAEIGEQS